MGNYYSFLYKKTEKELPAKLHGAALYVLDGASFPAMVEETGTVIGELMYLKPKKYRNVLYDIDILEGNGYMYKRRKVTVELEDGSSEPAWAYFWIASRRLFVKKIEHGDWIRYWKELIYDAH